MDPAKKPPNYYQEALGEPANLFTLAGIIGLSAITWSWVPLLLGAGAEALYMLFVPDSGTYRRWTDIRYAKASRQQWEAEKRDLVTRLWPDLAARYSRLQKLRESITSTCRESGEETYSLMSEDLNKLDFLLDSFLDFATTYMRYRKYMENVNERTIQMDIDRLQKRLKSPPDQATGRLLQQNLDILQKRMERLGTIRTGITNVQAQMDLIESTFNLLNDQMITIKSPEHLTVNLDDLISGVETTQKVVQETNPFLQDLKRMATAQIE